jgi:hypothetical protein
LFQANNFLLKQITLAPLITDTIPQNYDIKLTAPDQQHMSLTLSCVLAAEKFSLR